MDFEKGWSEGKVVEVRGTNEASNVGGDTEELVSTVLSQR